MPQEEVLDDNGPGLIIPSDPVTETDESSITEEIKVAKTRIYDDAVDKNVAAVVIYANDDKFYYDADYTVEVPEDDMLNLFFKGVVVVTGTDEYAKPVGFAEGTFVFFEAGGEG